MDDHATAVSEKDENCQYRKAKMLRDQIVEPCRVSWLNEDSFNFDDIRLVVFNH
jgi:hypothetical protein